MSWRRYTIVFNKKKDLQMRTMLHAASVTDLKTERKGTDRENMERGCL